MSVITWRAFPRREVPDPDLVIPTAAGRHLSLAVDAHPVDGPFVPTQEPRDERSKVL